MSKDFTDNVVVHVKEENVEYLKFRALEKYNEKLDVKVFLNRGGVSKGVYESLNVRIAGNDKKENVLENVRRIAGTFNIGTSCICKGTQAHTDNILHLNETNMNGYAYEVNFAPYSLLYVLLALIKPITATWYKSSNSK